VDSKPKAKGVATKGTQSNGAEKAKTNVNAEKRNRIAKDVFAQNSQTTELYFTSDFIPFFAKQDAIAHANSLNNKEVTTVTKN
jgi:hypothetical protein